MPPQASTDHLESSEAPIAPAAFTTTPVTTTGNEGEENKSEEEVPVVDANKSGEGSAEKSEDLNLSGKARVPVDNSESHPDKHKKLTTDDNCKEYTEPPKTSRKSKRRRKKLVEEDFTPPSTNSEAEQPLLVNEGIGSQRPAVVGGFVVSIRQVCADWAGDISAAYRRANTGSWLKRVVGEAWKRLSSLFSMPSRKATKKILFASKPGKHSKALIFSRPKRTHRMFSPGYVVVGGAVVLAAMVGAWMLYGEDEQPVTINNGHRKRKKLKSEAVKNELSEQAQQACPESSMVSEVRSACITAFNASEAETVEYIQRLSQQADLRSIPVTGVYDTGKRKMLVDKPLSEIQDCSNYEYGIVGYYALPSGSQDSPSFYDADTFTKTLLSTVRRLVQHFPEQPPGGNGTTLDLANQILMWCGIPKGEAAKTLHAQCIDWLVEHRIHDEPRWFTQGINKLYLYTLKGEISFDSSNEWLSFIPGFKLSAQCGLTQLHYEPRLLKRRPNEKLIQNLPFVITETSEAIAELDGLPEQYDLMSLEKKSHWRLLWGSLNGSQHEIPGLSKSKIYGIQPDGYLEPDQFFAFYKGRQVNSPVIPTEWKSFRNKERRHFVRQQQYRLPDRYQPLASNGPSPRMERVFYASGVEAIALSVVYAYSKENSVIKRALLLAAYMGYLVYEGYQQNRETILTTPYIDFDSEKRYKGLVALKNHYFEEAQYDRYNLLATLMVEEGTPLGVFHFLAPENDRSTTAIYEGKTYQPLSTMEFSEQLLAFDKAVKSCDSFYGSCDYANSDNLDYLRMALAVCTDQRKKICGNIWKDKSSQRSWWGLVYSLDWPEKMTALTNRKIPQGQYVSYPLLVNDKRSLIWQLRIGSKGTGTTEGLAPSPVAIKGEYSCYQVSKTGQLHADSCLAVDGKTSFINPPSALFLLWEKSSGKKSSVRMVRFQKSLMQAPFWKRERAWFNQNKVVDEVDCNDLQKDNLRSLCLGESSYDRKRLMLVLDRFIENHWLIPSYQKNEYENVLDLNFSLSTQHINELSESRINTHITLLMKYPELMEKDPAGIRALMHTGVIIGRFTEEGSFEDYTDLYRYLAEMKQKLDGLSSRCFRKELYNNEWCKKSGRCILFVPTWVKRDGWGMSFSTRDAYSRIGHLMMQQPASEAGLQFANGQYTLSRLTDDGIIHQEQTLSVTDNILTIPNRFRETLLYIKPVDELQIKSYELLWYSSRNMIRGHCSEDQLAFGKYEL